MLLIVRLTREIPESKGFNSVGQHVVGLDVGFRLVSGASQFLWETNRENGLYLCAPWGARYEARESGILHGWGLGCLAAAFDESEECALKMGVIEQR